MEIIVLLAILMAVLNNLAVQVWLIKSMQAKEQSAPQEQLLPEELEARQKAAEAQAKYEQGFVNLMCYDGMPARKKEGMLG